KPYRPRNSERDHGQCYSLGSRQTMRVQHNTLLSGSCCSSSHALLVRILHPLFYARPAPLCSVVDQFENYERGLTVAAVCGAVKQMNGTLQLVKCRMSVVR